MPSGVLIHIQSSPRGGYRVPVCLAGSLIHQRHSSRAIYPATYIRPEDADERMVNLADCLILFSQPTDQPREMTTEELSLDLST